MVLYHHSIMTLWYYNTMVLWYYSQHCYSIMQLYGTMILQLDGSMVQWLYYYMVLWCYRFTPVWFYGFTESLYYDSIVLHYYGFSTDTNQLAAALVFWQTGCNFGMIKLHLKMVLCQRLTFMSCWRMTNNCISGLCVLPVKLELPSWKIYHWKDNSWAD